MSGVCILTDTTAQFPEVHFPGHSRVSVIPLHIQVNQRQFHGGEGLRVQNLPVSARNGLNPVLQPPATEEFQQAYLYLGNQYDEIVVILTSSALSTSIQQARRAVATVGGRVEIQVIDSQTTAAGLGLLVRAAAEAATSGATGVEIKRLVLGLIPHVYAMLYIAGLSYLSHAGIVGSAQAIVAEMLGVMPLFIMEGGQLVPVQKARSSRHLVDCLHEFVCEFSDLQHIAVMQGVPPFDQEVRALRERVQEDFPATSLSEHTISSPLATVLGPRSLGVFIMEAD